ncbi:MAG: hypothetical protein ABS41_07440 [Arenimonas sp. SCN 70-307]|uniref:transcription termination/antitermination NusG family protein n=1 Tax=Arenimonas sp. SCN 70-307 TaxID=1660089 RepID=UPI00086D5D23|nr:transcription termination/antitermination NusG family protein [Arenimonas sp. SCN 70-307]ODS62997.1 MAG: hypothetical protein ABS41_07440 [Arenimonas sp. SCN 70-307]
MLRWYCVHTRPRAEAQALEHLRRQGFECFLPRLRRGVLRVRGGRRQVVTEALFPRYLFLCADADVTSLAPVRSTRGAVDLVRIAGQPACVPDDFIARLISDADGEGVITLPEPRFQPGERVTINDGPLVGLEALYARAEGEHRVIVLVELLGGAQEILLPRHVLKAAKVANAA